MILRPKAERGVAHGHAVRKWLSRVPNQSHLTPEPRRCVHRHQLLTLLPRVVAMFCLPDRKVEGGLLEGPNLPRDVSSDSQIPERGGGRSWKAVPRKEGHRSSVSSATKQKHCLSLLGCCESQTRGNSLKGLWGDPGTMRGTQSLSLPSGPST